MRMKKTIAMMMLFVLLSVLLTRLYALQLSLKGERLSKTRSHLVIFHPHTGLCVRRTSLLSDLKLASCTESDGWHYTPTKLITLVGTYFCLQVDGLGKPAKLGIICTDSNSKWDVVFDSKSYLLSKSNSGEAVCLDSDSNNTIVTTACNCLNSDNSCDPMSQWFKLVESTSVGN